MSTKRKTPQQLRDDSKARYEKVLYEKALTVLKNPKAKYDAISTGSDKKRRAPAIEMENEDKLFRPYDRLKMINLCRELERNSTAAKSIQRQFAINVVGNLGKLQFNSADEALNNSINDYFNKDYAVNCDARSDQHFSELLKLDLGAVIREGDEVIAFDDFDLDDGKLLRWEADQVVEISEKDWALQKKYVETVRDSATGKEKTIPLQQSSGVIYNQRGKILFLSVSSKRGLTVAPLNEVTILPVGSAKLIKKTFRHNQLRGNGEFFALIADIEDIYEMRSKELQSAKKAAETAMTVSKEDSMDEGLLRGGLTPEALLATADGTAEVAAEIKVYEVLESLTGGKVERLIPGEEVKVLNAENRPNIHMSEFFNFVYQGAGAGLGLAKAYTMMQAYNSYTAFRGEMLMTWATFYDWQKFLERHICDWIAIKAIEWAIRKKKLKVTLPENWTSLISWVWPQMPQVDPVKDNQARRESMKDGFSDFALFLGPDWKKKLQSIGEGLNYARDLGLPLTAFETRSGGFAQDGNNNNSNNDNSGGDNDEQD